MRIRNCARTTSLFFLVLLPAHGVLAQANATLKPLATRVAPLVSAGSLDLGQTFDSPNQRYFVVGGSDTVRIVGSDGSIRATIDRAQDAHLSRRGDRLLFNRSLELKPVGGDGSVPDAWAWTVGVDTATGRLTEAPRRVGINAGNYPKFSPSGNEITYVRQDARGWRIVAIPSRGGEERVVIERPGRIFTQGWSNDGRWIYYGHTPPREAQRLERVAASGGRPDSVVAGTGAFLGFSRDGQYFAALAGRAAVVIFRANGERVGDVPLDGGWPSWSASISNRLIAGDVRSHSKLKSIALAAGTISEWPSATGYDADPVFTPDSKRVLFLGLVNGRDQFFIADADGKNRRALPTSTAPVAAALVSPDSRYAAFTSERASRRPRSLYVLDLVSGVERKLVTSAIGRFAWRSDGTAITYVDASNAPRRAIRQVALDGTVSLVRDVGAFEAGNNFGFLNDTLVVAASRKGLNTLSLQTGATRILYDGAVASSTPLALSRDGQWMAFTKFDTTRPNEELVMMSLDGKQTRTLARNPYCGLTMLGWHPNAREAFVTKSLRCDDIDDERVYVASLNGNPLRDLTPDEPLGSIGDIALRPDAQQIVFSSVRERSAKVIAIDLTLPPKK